MNAAPVLDDVGACVFDAYGTLFDTSATITRCREELGDRADGLAATWRGKQLEYTWLRSLMGEYVDFWHVTGDALDYAMAVHRVDDPALRSRLMDQYLRLETFAEVADVLARLREGGVKTAILSNGSPTMLIAACKNAGIDLLIDQLLSVDALEVFKPHSSVYQLAVDELHIPAEKICFMSSNAWDVAGAAHFGFRVVWINRYGQPPENLPGHPEQVIANLSALPGLLGL